LDNLVFLEIRYRRSRFAILLIGLIFLKVENPDELRSVLHNGCCGNDHDAVVEHFENKQTYLTGPELSVGFI
jgi:hypothetical protein